MNVIKAGTAGFCAGVSRAVRLAEAAADKYGAVYCLGSLVHNQRVTADLAEAGAKTIADVNEIPDGAVVVIRSHGEAPTVFEQLKRKGCVVIDATCPHVKRIHRIAADASNAGRTLIILGDALHPEVQATGSYSSHNLVIFPEESEVDKLIKALPLGKLEPITVVSQTTADLEKVRIFCKLLKKDCTNAIFCDTICSATSERQTEARVLAQNCEAVVVVGDTASSNANRLADICRKVNPNTYFISAANELKYEQVTRLRSYSSVGLTAGASTPERTVQEVNNTMTDTTKDIALDTETGEVTPVIAEPASTEAGAVAKVNATPDLSEADTDDAAVSDLQETSFDALLDANFKVLRTGQKVTGIVLAISPTEVTVDLGSKQSAYIPAGELTDKPDVPIEELVKVGEPVEAYVVRVNDVEGFITLSKRRLDTSKNWEIIESAVDTRAVLEGTVIEENRGGVIVNVMGTRVFVPGSQSGLAKDVPLTELLKQKVKLRVIEASKVRNRVVGSIRSAKDDTRRERSQKIWEDIEEGKVYRGRVKTLTDFGAFIDIGGVDGMAHISTLSWVRIKHPSDVLTEGQEVDVYVVGLDREKKKISLGYRDLNENPFVKFTEKYHTGDVIEVKIVKLATYGAFAQIMPDVDGLIHVSEISDNRIEKPSDALVEDELVNVRIINIDYDKKRVSLSIRAVNNYNPPDEASEYSDYSPIAAVADETADAAVEATNEVSNEE